MPVQPDPERVKVSVPREALAKIAHVPVISAAPVAGFGAVEAVPAAAPPACTGDDNRRQTTRPPPPPDGSSVRPTNSVPSADNDIA